MIDAQSIAVPSRRGFVAGTLALLAAPVVVKASSLMKVAPTEIIRPDTVYGSLRVGATLRIRLPNDYVVSDGPGLLSLQEPTSELREFVVTEGAPGNNLLSIREITREAIQHFQNSNAFIEDLNRQYERDFEFVKGQQWAYNKERRSLDRVDPVIDKLALAVAAPVVVAKALEQPVTRRFWSNRSKSDADA